MRSRRIALLILILLGFALRLYYLTIAHPFFDEYTSVLAARQILREGWPVLPSGLFYEHGLLATYVMAPFTALFINISIEQWQEAHWKLMLSRWPSVIIGTATIPLIFAIGQRIHNQLPPTNYQLPHRPSAQNAALFAAGLFALSPEGVVWGGRARMYALATFLVLLTVYWAYQGAVYPAPARYRWLALLTLLAALLTQFGAMTLIPPLVIAMLIVGWLSYKSYALRVWFLRKTVLLEGLVLALVTGLAILVKRLGRPLGSVPLGDPAGETNFLTELFKTVAYQTAFHFTWEDAIEFLAREFGIPHHFWLAVVTLIGLFIGLIFWAFKAMREEKREISLPCDQREVQGNEKSKVGNKQWSYSNFFLCLVFGLVILEMVTLLEPFRRNPRYIVMVLPLFYLIAAQALFNFGRLFQLIVRRLPITPYVLRFTFYAPHPHLNTLLILILLTAFTSIGFGDLRIALTTPEPAYEEAFRYLRSNWQAGDRLLTMNTPAAGLYLGHVDGFTVQNEADQFLLNAEAAPVDRWLGAPWIGTMADFTTVLNRSQRSWFVSDTIRQPVYFRGDWQAMVNSQMELVWSGDDALIYRTRPGRVLLPTQPETLVQANLDYAIELVGYTLELPDQNHSPEASRLDSAVTLTLFWQSLAPISTDYTTFLHLRNSDGATVAQHDRQPLDGSYPTSRWRPNETVIDSITLPLPETLPPGTYTLFTGLYQLDTLARVPIVNDASGENAIRLGEVTLP